MFSAAKKVDLQFAMEATTFELLTFEEFLAASMLHMFRLGNKASFLRRCANYIFI